MISCPKHPNSTAFYTMTELGMGEPCSACLKPMDVCLKNQYAKYEEKLKEPKPPTEFPLVSGDVSDVYENSSGGGLKLSEINITEKNIILIRQMYFLDNRTQQEIAENIGVTQGYVSRVVSESKGLLGI